MTGPSHIYGAHLPGNSHEPSRSLPCGQGAEHLAGEHVGASWRATNWSIGCVLCLTCSLPHARPCRAVPYAGHAGHHHYRAMPRSAAPVPVEETPPGVGCRWPVCQQANTGRQHDAAPALHALLHVPGLMPLPYVDPRRHLKPRVSGCPGVLVFTLPPEDLSAAKWCPLGDLFTCLPAQAPRCMPVQASPYRRDGTKVANAMEAQRPALPDTQKCYAGSHELAVLYRCLLRQRLQ